MRLIDTDKAIKKVEDAIEHAGGAENAKVFSANDLIKIMENQPVAYDLDKVVEQLEKEKNPLYREDGSLLGERTVIRIDKAIEIVKGGGVDGN